jgi:anti-anti-sigma factor
MVRVLGLTVAGHSNETHYFPLINAVQARGGAVLAVARDYYESGQEAGKVAARVMRGESPSRIPFIGFSGTKLLVNPSAAQEVGVTIPDAIVARADEVVGRQAHVEITRKRTDDIVEVELIGRLDGYWCDHLNAALTEVLREGNHHIRIDCAQVSYLTSAGIGVLMKCQKELARIHGIFRVVNPSSAVASVLRITHLDTYLIGPAAEAAAPVRPRERPARRVEYDDLAIDAFDLDTQATLTCRAIGTTAPLEKSAFDEQSSASLGPTPPALLVGVGAFGASFADCRSRFGELLSVGGATAYQPGDGTNVADYLVAAGGAAADIRVLYGLACEGGFSHLLRFETTQPGAAVGVSRLIAACFDVTGADSLGMVVTAEASGLIGAALRRSPTERLESEGFFAHPGVRARLTFTAEAAFPRSVALTAGVVTRTETSRLAYAEQLRAIGPTCSGHLPAAFRFRPIRKGPITLNGTVTGLFEPDQLLGVMHLLYDDRAIAGAGESELVRGACWVGPIRDHGGQ